MTKRLTYVGQTPAEGTGSPVIILRHLRRLADHGWKISIIAEHGQDTSACQQAGWQVQRLPHRRPWWPPFRPDRTWSRRVRTYLLGRECRRLTAGSPPDAILGYLAAHADFSAEVAAHFSAQTRTPFTLLVHDDAAAFAHSAEEKLQQRRRHAWIMRQSTQCWFVSPELAVEYDVPPDKRDVLWPIPEGWTQPAAFSAERSAYPKIYYAGFIWPPQYPLLGELARAIAEAGGRLVLLTRDTPELRKFLQDAPAEWMPPFPSNREALAHLVSTAAGLLVSYTRTTGEMPWVATSFPSKFVEYSHLGLPCAIVAPEQSAIGGWARRAAFPYFFTAEQQLSFRDWAAGLRNPVSWRAGAVAAQNLARGEFSPEHLQELFETKLLRQT